MTNSKIGSAEAIALILIIIISHLLLNIPQTILNTCGTSSLLKSPKQFLRVGCFLRRQGQGCNEILVVYV